MENKTDSTNIPVGNDFLKAVRGQEDKCGTEFDTWILSAGVQAPETLEALGTALWYLDRLASCWWGCRGGGHDEEYLMGKAVSNATAAIRMLRAGYYDQALALIRPIGETANLIYLFTESKESRDKWLNASEAKRRQGFAYGPVLRRLKALTLPLPMDKDLYGLLSGKYTHVERGTPPQLHNPIGLSTVGGYFQKVGALVALNHLGEMVGWVLCFGAILVKPPTDQKGALSASVELLSSIGRFNLNSIEDYYDEIRKLPQSQEAEEALKQWQSIRRKMQAENQSLPEAGDTSTKEV